MKVGNGQVVDQPIKAPYIRAKIAQQIPFECLSDELIEILTYALNKIMAARDVTALLKVAREKNPGY